MKFKTVLSDIVSDPVTPVICLMLAIVFGAASLLMLKLEPVRTQMLAYDQYMEDGDTSISTGAYLYAAECYENASSCATSVSYKSDAEERLALAENLYNYHEALEYYADENYEEAIKYFILCGDYGDSDTYYKKCLKEYVEQYMIENDIPYDEFISDASVTSVN